LNESVLLGRVKERKKARDFPSLHHFDWRRN
jgi:hypothetical protein